jgi:acid phosphatase type 7
LVVISSVDDAYVRGNRTTTNYGSNTALLVDTSSVRYHTYIKPNNLSDISPGAMVVSATLVLTQSDAGSNVEVHPVLGAWNESSITYNTQPAVGSTLTTFSASSNGEKRIDITSLAQQWVNGGALNGVQLYPTGSDGVDFRSSEYGTATQRPRFEIEVIE